MNKAAKTTGIIGIIIGVCISLGNLHQLIRVIILGDSSQISIFLYGILVLAGATWLIHGVARKNKYLIITQAICLFVNIPSFIYYLVNRLAG
jgi:uncharacterized protein with PQ loop repeat